MVTAARRPVAAETQFQQAVTDLADWLHIWWWHDEDPRRNKAGFPDLLLVGRRGVLWRELKTETGTVRKAQQELGDLLSRSQDWAIWRPADLASGRVKAELEAIR